MSSYWEMLKACSLHTPWPETVSYLVWEKYFIHQPMTFQVAVTCRYLAKCPIVWIRIIKGPSLGHQDCITRRDQLVGYLQTEAGSVSDQHKTRWWNTVGSRRRCMEISQGSHPQEAEVGKFTCRKHGHEQSRFCAWHFFYPHITAALVKWNRSWSHCSPERYAGASPPRDTSGCPIWSCLRRNWCWPHSSLTVLCGHTCWEGSTSIHPCTHYWEISLLRELGEKRLPGH